VVIAIQTAVLHLHSCSQWTDDPSNFEFGMLEALIDVVTEWAVSLLCLGSLLHVLVRLLFLLLYLSVSY
jgi:hypothetical protein